MSDVDYPVSDFDNHYYEAMDAFTRHLDPRLGGRCVQWAEINGRKYGVEENGRTFPISGNGLVELDRNEYAALTEIAKAGGRTDVPALTRNPRFANNPAAVEKAKQVYDGTYQ